MPLNKGDGLVASGKEDPAKIFFMARRGPAGRDYIYVSVGEQ